MTHGFLKSLALRQTRELRVDGFENVRIRGNGRGNLDRWEKTGFVGVVEIGRIVGHLVGQIDQLGFERRPQPGQIFV